MPYEIRKEHGGYKVANKETGKTYSKKPLPKARAQAQQRAIYANTHNESRMYAEGFDSIVSDLLNEEIPDFIKEKIEAKKGKKDEKGDKGKKDDKDDGDE